MSLQQDASDLKAFLDGIAADVAPIKSGIDSMAANLAAALATETPDPNILKAALDEAQSLKGTFDQLAASFAKAGSPVPVTANPTPEPEPAPVPSTDGTAPAPAEGEGSAPADKPADAPAT